ncbi:MAG: recombinase family protein [Dysgonomonas sp.]
MNKLHKTTISRSAFHVAVRNPLYYGKIFIAKFKDEEAHLVQGQHEPLISKELFDRVQLILDGNKRVERPNTKILSDENLPLRGFLVCPECGRNLTGSASNGITIISIFNYSIINHLKHSTQLKKCTKSVLNNFCHSDIKGIE